MIKIQFYPKDRSLMNFEYMKQVQRNTDHHQWWE